MATISLPTPLPPYAEKNSEVPVQGTTVGELLGELTNRYPQLRNHLFGDDGNLRSFVNVYLNDEDIRYLQKTEPPVQDSDLLSIIPSIAGGSQ